MNYNHEYDRTRPQRNSNRDENYGNSQMRPRRRKAEDLDEVIERRNYRLQRFFDEMNLPVRIIGDKNTPAIIFEDKYILNAYVHNFELRFTDAPFDGSVIYTVKLSENPVYDRKAVEDCIYDYDLRPAYRVQLLNTSPELYLSGYNFLNKADKEGRYPVFSLHGSKIYFTREKAEEVAAELSEMGYQTQIA